MLISSLTKFYSESENSAEIISSIQIIFRKQSSEHKKSSKYICEKSHF